jgi:hypothetical protein
VSRVIEIKRGREGGTETTATLLNASESRIILATCMCYTIYILYYTIYTIYTN